MCGAKIEKYGSIKLGYCSKHYKQIRKYGEVKDHNHRTVWDPNEVRVFDDYAEIDTYDQFGNVIETYTIDKEDLPFLGDHKWRTVYKGTKVISPYLVTGHTIYFHVLVMGNPNSEVDHIDRNSRNNRKSNLRLATRQEQMYNTLKYNKTGIKGVYYNERRPNRPWRSECHCDGQRYHSPQYETKEEAVYYRYLLETRFLKDFLVCNTEDVNDCIKNISDVRKAQVEKDFEIKMGIKIDQSPLF